MKQSRTMSAVESVTNVAVGFGVALATQLLLFPLFGIAASIGEHFAISAVFTVVSVIRSYVLRRGFEAVRVKSAAREEKTALGAVYFRTSRVAVQDPASALIR